MKIRTTRILFAFDSCSWQHGTFIDCSWLLQYLSHSHIFEIVTLFRILISLKVRIMVPLNSIDTIFIEIIIIFIVPYGNDLSVCFHRLKKDDFFVKRHQLFPRKTSVVFR